MAFIDDIASKLSGRTRAETNSVMTDATTRTYVGTATSASEDGSVYVALSQDVTLPDDDDGEHGIGVEMPTTVGVSEGDEVLVTVFGGGVMKAPVVTGNPGWGDSLQAQVDNAEALAEQAEAVASATGQHFWPDTDGVHVTEVTQDEWNDSTSPNYHSGANVLLNALGQLFRDGVNNILAIVSGTDPGIAIYDGNGNSADNILALLTKSLIRLGGRFAASGRSTAKVQFFEDDSALTDLTAEHYIDTTTEPQVSHDLALSSTITDDELPNGTSRTVTGNVEVWEQIYNDGTDYSDEVTVSLNGMTTNRMNNVSMGVQAIQDSSESWRRTAFAVADNLRLTHGTGSQASTSDIPMEQAVAALTAPYWSNAKAVNVPANTDVKGSAVTVPAGSYVVVVEGLVGYSSGSNNRTVNAGLYVGGSVHGHSLFAMGGAATVRVPYMTLLQLTAQTSLQGYVRSSAAAVGACTVRIYVMRMC